MYWKELPFSDQDRPESLSDDGESISVAGMKWFPKDDIISLDIKNMNFDKKIRGWKPAAIINIIKSKPTRLCF